MRILIIQHDADGGPGVLLPPLESAAEIAYWRVWESPERPDLDGFDAVVSLGGTAHPDQDDTHPWLAAELDLLEEALDFGTPVLGVCLGSQLLARAGGGQVGQVERPEVGVFRDVGVRAEARDDLLFAALPRPFFGLEWHYYGFELPPGATLLAANDSSNQAFRLQNRAWGVQFHLEIDAPGLLGWADLAPEVIEAAGGRARFEKSIETFMDQSTAAARSVAERFAVVVSVTAGELPPAALDALEHRPDPIAEAQAAGVPPEVIAAMLQMRDQQRF